MSVAWIASQIQSMQVDAPNIVRFNPRPPGVIREGSATDAVLAHLRAHPARFFCHHEIVAATGRSKVAVDWALIYLKDQGLIQCVSDAFRNSRYLRYRIVKE
jgi:hypothetical protein